jgi:pimeloyl-ACP methyl ester carboxylesterase
MLRTAMSFVLVLAGVLLALALFLRWYEPRMIYFPARAIERTPADLGLSYEDVSLAAEDGASIHGWFLPSGRTGAATVLLLHGNAGNISHRFDKLAVLRELGADVLIIDYRGYGRSTGSPSEQGTYRDAEAAYAWLTGKRGLAPGAIVVYGESLGAAVAADLAARHPVAGLVLESGFTSAVDVGQEMFPFLPARWLVRHRYESTAKLGRVKAAVLVLHSRDDEFFGWHHARGLYEAAPGPKRLVELRGGHNDAFLVSAPLYRSALSEFFAQLQQSN